MVRGVTMVCFVLMGVQGVRADVIHVPADYPTIQEAINAAVNGDTVLVSPGTYVENINFRGRNIVVASEFLLDVAQRPAGSGEGDHHHVEHVGRFLNDVVRRGGLAQFACLLDELRLEQTRLVHQAVCAR